MDPAAPDDRRRRRLLIATIAGGLVLLLLVGVGVYGLLRGPAPRTDTTPAVPSVPSATTTPAGPNGQGPVAVPKTGGPETFARAVAAALFTWDTTSGYQTVDYAQMLANVAADEEADALAGDVRAYLPNPQAWAQLRQYQTRQWLTIDTAVIPTAWETAVAQAAPGQLPRRRCRVHDRGNPASGRHLGHRARGGVAAGGVHRVHRLHPGRRRPWVHRHAM